jgi:hypothetical protein
MRRPRARWVAWLAFSGSRSRSGFVADSRGLASIPCLAHQGMGNREWSLRLQAPPPTFETIWVRHRLRASTAIGQVVWVSGRRPHHPPSKWLWRATGREPICRLGRWSGYPGAGPIRGCHRDCTPTVVLTRWPARTAMSARERGPENGCPDHLPRPHFRAQHGRPLPPNNADRQYRQPGAYNLALPPPRTQSSTLT